MKDLRDLKDYDDALCKIYERRSKYVVSGSKIACLKVCSTFVCPSVQGVFLGAHSRVG